MAKTSTLHGGTHVRRRHPKTGSHGNRASTCQQKRAWAWDWPACLAHVIFSFCEKALHLEIHRLSHLSVPEVLFAGLDWRLWLDCCLCLQHHSCTSAIILSSQRSGPGVHYDSVAAVTARSYIMHSHKGCFDGCSQKFVETAVKRLAVYA